MRNKFADQCQILARANIMVTFSIKRTAISNLGEDKAEAKGRADQRVEADQWEEQQIGDKDEPLTRTDLA